MSLRDRLNRNSGITLGVVGAMAVIALVLAVMQVLAGRRTFNDGLPDSFYSADDGKTYFAANSKNVPPFEHEGQQAVQAYVFECHAERFVGWLERYTPEARQAVLAGKSTPQTQLYGRELKKPGGGSWVKSSDLAGVTKVTDVQCPHGQGGAPEPVEP